MSTFKPSYGSETSITITLNSLANGSVAISSAIDNSTNLFQDALIRLIIAGTAAANAWLDVRILPCVDGTNYADFDEGIVLPACLLATSPMNYIRLFSETGILALPKNWKLAVKNNTGAALSSAGNLSSYEGVNMTSV